MTMTDQELAIFLAIRDGMQKMLDESSVRTRTLLEIRGIVKQLEERTQKLEEHIMRPPEPVPVLPPLPDPPAGHIIRDAHKAKPTRKH